MRKLILAGVLATALLFAAVASADIVVQKSIAGVSIGLTEAQVTTILGPPLTATDDGTDQISGQPRRTLTYSNTQVGLLAGSVVWIDTIDKTQKTSKGARVGISEKSLKKKVKGLKCSGKGNKRFCFKGTAKAGAVVTTFTISSKKKVKVISLDLVID